MTARPGKIPVKGSFHREVFFRCQELPLLAILRDISNDDLEPLIAIIEAAGVRAVEITMNTPDAAGLIRRATMLAGKRLVVGAGTVLDRRDLDAALHAGAKFIVSPVFLKDVVAVCLKRHVPVFPGALTPQEIYTAWTAGATMVKVFPSGLVGPEYFRTLRGPFKDISLLACGGVTPENIGTYFACGAGAVTLGSSVFKKEWLADRNFPAMERLLKKYVRSVEQVCNVNPT